MMRSFLGKVLLFVGVVSIVSGSKGLCEEGCCAKNAKTRSASGTKCRSNREVQAQFFRDAEKVANGIVRDVVPDTGETRGEKGKQNTALILNSLAQTCLQISPAAKPKTQAILNVLGASLAAAAQLVVQNQQNSIQQATSPEQQKVVDDTVKALHELTIKLIDGAKQDEMRDVPFELTPLLREIQEGKTPEEQQSRLKKILMTYQQAQAYLLELLTLIHNYVDQKFDQVTELVSAYIVDKISDWCNGPKPEAAQVPAPEQALAVQPVPETNEFSALKTSQDLLQERADYVAYRVLSLFTSLMFSREEVVDAQNDVFNTSTRAVPNLVKTMLATDLVLFEKLVKDEFERSIRI